jgi:hypothetical protein
MLHGLLSDNFSVAQMVFKRRPAGCTYALALVHCLISLNPSQALDLKKALKSVVNVVVKAPNPIITPIQIATGKVPLDPKAYLQDQAKNVQAVINTARDVSNLPYDKVGAVVSEVGGDKVRIVYDLTTGAQRLQNEFVFTAAGAAAAKLAGQDPLVSVAIPLAAAIRDAHSKYDAQAVPFPPDVKSLLGQVMPADILDRGRYAIGELNISLPSIIIGGTNIFAKEGSFAVTVDDIVVFSHQPNFSDINDLVWVSHELRHVMQYRDWGVDTFAFNYLKNSRAVEDQAKAAASYVRSFLEQLESGQPIQPRVTYQGALAFAPTSV